MAKTSHMPCHLHEKNHFHMTTLAPPGSSVFTMSYQAKRWSSMLWLFTITTYDTCECDATTWRV